MDEEKNTLDNVIVRILPEEVTFLIGEYFLFVVIGIMIGVIFFIRWFLQAMNDEEETFRKKFTDWCFVFGPVGPLILIMIFIALFKDCGAGGGN